MENTAVGVRQETISANRLLRTFAAVRADLVLALVRLLGSSEDAQDVIQEAFLKCWRGRERVDEIRNLRAWIFRISLNTARDLQRNVWRRRARPLPDRSEDPAHPGLSPAEEVLQGEDLDRLRAALSQLRREERMIFLLRQNTGLTYEEIARRRHLPVGTVKTRMRTALQKLRAVLFERAGRIAPINCSAAAASRGGQ
jgi:RNA polymerase sigma-70 factor (ECF subfamily)